MTRGRQDERESIRREAQGLRDASLALESLDFNERRRVLLLICDRFCIDPAKLGGVNRDGTATGRV